MPWFHYPPTEKVFTTIQHPCPKCEFIARTKKELKLHKETEHAY